MQLYRHGFHTVYDLKVHLVWCTKYRKPFLSGRLALRVRELVREICLANSVQILKGHVGMEYIAHQDDDQEKRGDSFTTVTT